MYAAASSWWLKAERTRRSLVYPIKRLSGRHMEQTVLNDRQNDYTAEWGVSQCVPVENVEGQSTYRVQRERGELTQLTNSLPVVRCIIEWVDSHSEDTRREGVGNRNDPSGGRQAGIVVRETKRRTGDLKPSYLFGSMKA